MSLGFEQAGLDLVGGFDSDPINATFHRRNFPSTRTFCVDLADVSGNEIRSMVGIGGNELDVLFGGPPCQGFSEIGQRNGDDERSRLIFEFARLVRELRPRYFVVENVRGLLYGYSKPILDSFLRRVRRAGYQYVDPVQVLDASHFGVPQKRQRVFILGYRDGEVAPTYPEAKTPHAAYVCPTVQDAIGDLPDLMSNNEFFASDVFVGNLERGSEYAQLMRGDLIDPEDASYERSRKKGELTGFLRTDHSDAITERFAATQPGTSDKQSRCYRLRLDGQAYTLRAGTGPKFGSFTAARPIHPIQPRCITTREAARLHSFPDWFEFHPTKWHGFRQIGNSVPPRLARAVAMQIRVALAGVQ